MVLAAAGVRRGGMGGMRRLWPVPPLDLDDASLLAMYEPALRAEPWLRVNFVASADGAVELDGYSEGLSSAADRAIFKILRMCCDALLVGAGTLTHEGYRPLRLDEERRAWRRAVGLPEYPVLVVVSGALSVPPEHPALADAPVRPIVVTHDQSPIDRRKALSEVSDVMVCSRVGAADAVDLTAVRDQLTGRGLAQLLCEGGPHLFGGLAAADLVDELCLTMSPLLTGPGADRIIAGPATATVRRLRLAHVITEADNVMLRYTRQRDDHGGGETPPAA